MKKYIEKLYEAFPQMFINDSKEAIIYPRKNIYFRLADCETENDVIKKLLCWLSKSAHTEHLSKTVRRYVLEGINYFLDEEFTREDMARIYTELGNGVNKELLEKFIKQGFNMNLLKELPNHIKPYYQ